MADGAAPQGGVTTLEFNRVRLREGNFNTRLIRVIGETQFSPIITLVNNVQFNTVSSVIGLAVAVPVVLEFSGLF